jgi:hypothetical protein
MITKFYDMQEDKDHLNGTEIADSLQLLQILDSLRERPPFICELVGENGISLSFGIGLPVGCVQYRATNGEPPYFMATSNDPNIAEEQFEFLMGGTLTLALGHFCIEIKLLKQVLSYFQETGYRSPIVQWEEV